MIRPVHGKKSAEMTGCGGSDDSNCEHRYNHTETKYCKYHGCFYVYRRGFSMFKIGQYVEVGDIETITHDGVSRTFAKIVGGDAPRQAFHKHHEAEKFYDPNATPEANDAFQRDAIEYGGKPEDYDELRIVTDDDWPKLADKLQYYDDTRSSIEDPNNLDNSIYNCTVMIMKANFSFGAVSNGYHSKPHLCILECNSLTNCKEESRYNIIRALLLVNDLRALSPHAPYCCGNAGAHGYECKRYKDGYFSAIITAKELWSLKK